MRVTDPLGSHLDAPIEPPIVGRWPRVATVATFFAHGLLFASWTAHIPQIKSHLHLNNAALGVALLGAPLGSVLALLVSARLVGLAGSLTALFIAMLVWGAFLGALDVSMNTQAVAVERSSRRPLMSGFHGCWSIGAFAGAGLGVIGVAAGLSLTRQLLLLGVPILLVVGALTAQMLPDVASTVARPEARSSIRRLSRPVLVLGAIAFASMLCEGASADWASVYLRGPLHSSAATAGLAYTAFALAMVAIRLSGNRLLSRFQARWVLPVLGAIATIGFSAGLVAGRMGSAIIGFGCLGIGLALIVPTVFSAAGRLPGINPGTAIAAVSAFGWFGFVCGPPLIGGLSSATSLPFALGLLPVLTTGIVVSTGLTRALRNDSSGVP
jgi:hypothetical protein